jgi:hypothetical protein
LPYAENSNFFTQADVAGGAKPPAEDSKARLWTDDYSSLLPLIPW